METDQTIEVLSLEELNPHQRIRRTRDFRIDESKSGRAQYAYANPERAEKLQEHTERIQGELEAISV